MSKKKLIRFKANTEIECLFQPSALDLIKQDHEFKGSWSQKYFANNNEIVLELGCGRGEYTTGLARLNPGQNFIGVDIKGSRLFFGAKEVENSSLRNACFVRSQIELLPTIFAREINEIWVTFPDPYPDRQRRRLTSPNFLNRYRKILKENGTVCLKTDDYDLYQFTVEQIRLNRLELLEATDDLYNSSFKDSMPSIQTLYEQKFTAAGKKICFCKFRLNNEVAPLKPKNHHLPASQKNSSTTLHEMQ